MMQEQSKDDFLEAAALIFQRVLDNLFKRNNSSEITEEEKLNLLIDALKEVKKEHEVNIKVIDKLIDNPEETKELFKELLDQKIKSKEQFIAKASEGIKDILPKLSMDILNDYEKVNTTISKDQENNNVDLENEKSSIIEKNHPSIKQLLQDKELVLLGLIDKNYNGNIERIESNYPNFYLDYINHDEKENLFEFKFSTVENDWGSNDVLLKFNKDLSVVQAFGFVENNSENWGVGEYKALTGKMSYKEFIESTTERKELVEIIEKHTLAKNDFPRVLSDLPPANENTVSEVKIETTIELER